LDKRRAIERRALLGCQGVSEGPQWFTNGAQKFDLGGEHFFRKFHSCNHFWRAHVLDGKLRAQFVLSVYEGLSRLLHLLPRLPLRRGQPQSAFQVALQGGFSMETIFAGHSGLKHEPTSRTKNCV
jgi:hypothetical protein